MPLRFINSVVRGGLPVLVWLAAGLAAAGQRGPVRAAPGPAGPLRFSQTVWRAADGLPESTVQALAGGSDGSLWVGTAGGLANFNGAQMKAVSGPAALGVNSIFSLSQTRNGSVWAGTEGGGLLELGPGGERVFATGSGLSDLFVRKTFEDRAGRFWVGTDNGLFLMQGERLVRVDGTGTIPALSVHTLGESRDGRLWVGGSRLLALSPDHRVETFTLPGAYSQTRVKSILQTGDGTMWVGTVGGLDFYRGGRFEAVAAIHATVRSLLETADGTLWIGTIGDGLWMRAADGQFSHLRTPGLLPSDTVLAMVQDAHGEVWLGTQGGLVRLERTSVQVIPVPGGGDPDFATLSDGGGGSIWLAARRLYRVQDGVARPTRDPLLEHLPVRNVFRSRDGALWVGTDGSGVYRVDGRTVRHLSAPGELTNNFIRGFLETRGGAIWIATDEGVNRLEHGQTLRLGGNSGLAYFSTRCLLEARDGAVWIGTDRGVSRWQHGTFVQDGVTAALAHEKVWSLLEDGRGALWFGTRDHGLFRLLDGRLAHYTTEQGLPSNSVYDMIDDGRGTFWITGANVIASMPAAEMDGAEPHPDHLLSAHVYRLPYGAEDAQMYGGRQPAGVLAAGGSVYFPTSRGVAHVVAAEDAQAGSPPRAVIESASADARALDLAAPLRLNGNVSKVTFAYGAIYLPPIAGVHFRYQLEGFDHGWNAAGAAGAATYTNLPAGSYRFRAQAFESGAADRVTEADLGFTKAPLPYQSAPFYTVCAASLVLLAWLIYRMRVRQIHVRFQAVLEERGRLAREMHDTVIQGCTGVSALLEAMASTGEHDAAPARANAELLDYARQQARITIDEARQAVYGMRSETDNEVDLTGPINTVAEQMVREYGTPVTVEHRAASMVLASHVAHEVLMVVREAVYNAVQHSGSQTIEIQTATTRDHKLLIGIEDHGCGFAPGQGRSEAHHFGSGHYGILGMYERVKRIGGHLEMLSRPGVGTTVRLSVRPRRTRSLAMRLRGRTRFATRSRP